MSDTTDKLVGKAKETAGKAMGDKRLEAKGRLMQDVADLRHQTKEEVQHITNKIHDKL